MESDELMYCPLAEYLEDSIREDDAIDTLRFAKLSLESSNFDESVVSFLKECDSFVELCGNDKDQWIDKIDNVLDYYDGCDVTEEGMKIQDFLRWGIGGLLFGAYFKNLAMIKSRIAKGLDKDLDDEKIKNRRSIYLPDANEAERIVNALGGLTDDLAKFASNFESAKSDDLKPILRKIENVISSASTDWRAIVGSIIGSALGAWLGSFIGKKSAFAGSIIGNVAGAHAASKNGGKLGSRGWNKIKLESMGKSTIALIDHVLKYQDQLTTIKGTIKDANDKEKKKELNAKARDFKKILKFYIQLVQVVGRGTAAALD